MSITRVGYRLFQLGFSLDFALVRHDAPSRLCLMVPARVSAYRVRNDCGYVKGFYLEGSVWF